MAETKDIQFEKVNVIEGAVPSVENPVETVESISAVKNIERISSTPVENTVVEYSSAEKKATETPVNQIELPDTSASVSDGDTWLGLSNYKVANRGSEIRE
jgi:hypothetical protein